MTEEQIKKIKTAHTKPESTECIKTCADIYKEETGLDLSADSKTKLSDIIDMQVGKAKTTDEQIIEALNGLINIATNS